MYAIDNAGGGSALTSSVPVTITIDPVNEADPIFQNTPYSPSKAEDLAVGSLVVTVSRALHFHKTKKSTVKQTK